MTTRPDSAPAPLTAPLTAPFTTPLAAGVDFAFLPGDHDFEPGTLDASYTDLGARRLSYGATVRDRRCLFRDLVSAGGGGPDGAVDRDAITVGTARATADVPRRGLSAALSDPLGGRPLGTHRHRVGTWAERGVLGTQLGPNARGRKW